MVHGNAGSGNLNPGWRKGGKVDIRSVGEENKGYEVRGIGGEETRRRGEKEEKMK